MTCKLYSQNSETISIPVKDALKVLAAADSAKIHKVYIGLLKQDIENLNLRIENLIISREAYRQADSICQQEMKLADQQMMVMADQRKIAEGFIKGLNKQIRKQKRKTFWTAMAGVATTVGAIFILK